MRVTVSGMFRGLHVVKLGGSGEAAELADLFRNVQLDHPEGQVERDADPTDLVLATMDDHDERPEAALELEVDPAERTDLLCGRLRWGHLEQLVVVRDTDSRFRTPALDARLEVALRDRDAYRCRSKTHF